MHYKLVFLQSKKDALSKKDGMSTVTMPSHKEVDLVQKKVQKCNLEASS